MIHLYIMGEIVDWYWVLIGKSEGNRNLRDLDIENIDIYLKYLTWGFEVGYCGLGCNEKAGFYVCGGENYKSVQSPSNYVLPIQFQSNLE